MDPGHGILVFLPPSHCSLPSSLLLLPLPSLGLGGTFLISHCKITKQASTSFAFSDQDRCFSQTSTLSSIVTVRVLVTLRTARCDAGQRERITKTVDAVNPPPSPPPTQNTGCCCEPQEECSSPRLSLTSVRGSMLPVSAPLSVWRYRFGSQRLRVLAPWPLLLRASVSLHLP